MIYMRADANSNVGMGHIMRCLSIADAFQLVGQEITFVLADTNAQPIVNKRGYESLVLQSDYKLMETELQLWGSRIQMDDYIIVDSYYVTEDYLKALRSKAKLIYIDDVAAFPYPVDILVNYNIYSTLIDYHKIYKENNMQEPIYALGSIYVPLRSMFHGLPKKIQPPKVQNVLISTGGSDPFHITISLIKKNLQNYKYHVLIGALNSDKEEIKKLADTNPNIIIHENVIDMKTLISSCDIVVSAAGSTLYEICACGVPLITYVVADNQILGAEVFECLGLAINLGDIRTATSSAKMIINAVEELSMDYGRRVKTGLSMQELIDGNGAKRLAKYILERN